MRSFPGLAHRMEQVGRRGNVLFVNDFKGTNADATAHALSSFADIFWIAGGKPKQGGITSLTGYFPRIRKAYLIGEAAQEFSGTLGEGVPHEISETLDVAVANAARDAEASGLADPVVLLSPACACSTSTATSKSAAPTFDLSPRCRATTRWCEKAAAAEASG